MVKGLGIRVYRVWGLGFIGFRVWGLGFIGFRVWEFGFIGFRVWEYRGGADPLVLMNPYRASTKDDICLDLPQYGDPIIFTCPLIW